jgi:hypothetical protein
MVAVNHTRLAPLFLFSALSTLIVVGCSDDTSSATGDPGSTSTGQGTGGATTTATGTGGATTSASSGTGTGAGGPECDGPGYSGGEPTLAVDNASATLVDLAGDPVADTDVQLCGLNICITEKTGATGSVIVNVDDDLVAPFFKYGDGLYGKLAIPVTEAISDFGTLTLPQLPPLAGAPTLAPGATVTSGDVTLTIPAEGSVTIDELIYDEVAKQGFRTATMPVADAALAIEPGLGLELLYVASPLETVFCPPAQVTVPNTEGWAAGTEVEFIIQGYDAVSQPWAPYGGWQVVSDGVVSEDGTTVSTVAEGGLPVLSTFGIRLK